MRIEDVTDTTVERALIERARERQAPINGSLELSPLCNFNCDMCYVRLSRGELERRGRLRTGKEWLALGREMAEAGVLLLLLTGGEPLLYPDFKEVYLGLREMGFVLTLNTNGSLIDEEWADFFARYPLRRVNITLYGKGPEEYGRLCHDPTGFDRTVRGIRLLRQRGIHVKIGVSVTRANRDSLKELFALGAELDAPVHIDPYMMPAVRERERPFDQQARILPEEGAAASLEAMKMQFSPDIIRQYAQQATARVEDPDFPRGDGSMSCLAGSCSFTVNWQGEMRPCVILSQPAVPVFETGFQAAWKEIRAQLAPVRISPTCVQCRYQPVCKTCAAAALTETGRYDGTPEYLCRFAKETYRLLKEELAGG